MGVFNRLYCFQTLAAACGKFAPFEIKENVYLAPLCRVQREDGVLEELDRCLLNQAENWHGLRDWIGRQPRQSGPTKPTQSESSRCEWQYRCDMCSVLCALVAFLNNCSCDKPIFCWNSV